jgi:signal peptidase I
VVLLVAAVIVIAGATRTAQVTTAAMEPAIRAGATVSYDPRPGALRRGEIIVFRIEHGDSRLIASRVVALPGDSVEVRDGHLYVNGQPQVEPFVTVPMAYSVPLTRLTSGQYFVLGDNRNDSLDSHLFGPLPGREVVGVVVS